ncbi:MAG: glycerate kinase [Bacteroidales bacterium]|nr:glycerate kinase [Bacteroidales bacterium]
MNWRETAKQIFIAGVTSVLPGKLIESHLSLKGNVLHLGNRYYDLDRIGKIYIIGAGKASAAMGHFVEHLLGDKIAGGHIVVKYGHYCRLRHVKVTEAGHPVPDENSFRATAEIIDLVKEAGENDLVICLFSGGGSSLLADVPERSVSFEIIRMNELLVKCGANINEINCVRKHLSKVKGGQLARHIWPASFINIIISDVSGDPLDIIASGPTVPDNSTFREALRVLEDYRIISQVPASILGYLYEGAQCLGPETPKPGDEVFKDSFTYIAGNNRTALNGSKEKAEDLGFNAFIVGEELKGDVNCAVTSISETINSFRNNNTLRRPVCLLYGGETTVKVEGKGMGGRNQHLALMAALRLQDMPGVTLLASGTDGNDGDTEMAGAVVDSETLHDALEQGIDPVSYLKEYDSYHFFKSAGGHVYTGPTLTNVMDMVVVLIE